MELFYKVISFIYNSLDISQMKDPQQNKVFLIQKQLFFEQRYIPSYQTGRQRWWIEQKADIAIICLVDHLQSIKLLKKEMNSRNQDANNPAPMVYGFFCQENNVFYAFQTHQEYQSFLSWFDNQSRLEEQPKSFQQPIQNDEQILLNSQRATEKIMEVFNDPIFQQTDYSMELEEIDF